MYFKMESTEFKQIEVLFQNIGRKHKKQQVIAQIINFLRNLEKNLYSPINLSISLTKNVYFSNLIWNYFDKLPKKMKLTNTGTTVVLSAKWSSNRPFITGGPLIGNYVFCQMHFHWGSHDSEGSEHTIDGRSYPGEIHVVFFRSKYLSVLNALKRSDGVVILVYFLQIINVPNQRLQLLIEKIPKVSKLNTTFKIDSYPLNTFLEEFSADYLMYWGNIDSHLCQWLITRHAVPISAEQMKILRSSINYDKGKILTENFREVPSLFLKHVYNVNPTESTHSTLLPISDEITLWNEKGGEFKHET